MMLQYSIGCILLAAGSSATPIAPYFAGQPLPQVESRPQTESRPHDTRTPIPQSEALTRSIATLRQTYKQEYSKTSPDARRKLAKDFHELALKTAANLSAPDVFGLLDEARSLYVLAGDVPSAFSVIASLQATYAVDATELRQQALGAIAPRVREQEVEAAASTVFDYMNSLLKGNDWKRAESALNSARIIMNKSKQLSEPVSNRWSQIQAAVEHAVRFGSALETLANNPKDAAANHMAGTYWCFEQARFDLGLPMLSLSSDKGLSQIAKADLSSPNDPLEQERVGNLWYSWSKRQSGAVRSMGIERAILWFSRAIPQVKSQDWIRLNKTLEEANATLSGSAYRVLDDPGDLKQYRDRVGERFRFRVTGATSGTIWGTEFYTDDSNLSVAAVHAGLLDDGETGIVVVEIAEGKTRYAGSTQNGVTSDSWSKFDGSCFRFLPDSRDSAPSDSQVISDPGNLVRYRGRIGKSLLVRVTGSGKGSIWGTDSYTDDSLLATAAVHAGILEVGQTAIVRVRIRGGSKSYKGTTRNGVTSLSFPAHPGSFTVEKVMSK